MNFSYKWIDGRKTKASCELTEGEQLILIKKNLSSIRKQKQNNIVPFSGAKKDA